MGSGYLFSNFLAAQGRLFRLGNWECATNHGHADSRTTKLYDRRGQKVLLEDMERIRY